MAKLFKSDTTDAAGNSMQKTPQKKVMKSKSGMSMKPDTAKSKFVIVLYAIAAALTVYGGYMIYYTIKYIISYYSSYGSSSTDAGSVIQYVISNSVLYFVYALLLFTSAKILKRVLETRQAVLEQTKAAGAKGKSSEEDE